MENIFDLAEEEAIDASLGEVYEAPGSLIEKLYNRELPIPKGFKLNISDGEFYELREGSLLGTPNVTFGYFRCPASRVADAYRKQYGGG